MLFHSPFYIFCFLPVVMAVYFFSLQWGQRRFITAWLVVASLFFYGYSALQYTPLLACSLLGNFFLGKLFLHAQKKKESVLNILLVAGVLLNIFPLAYFKYTDFFVENINIITGSHISSFGVVLPLAISFYSFQQIAFLVDCRRAGKLTDYTFLNYSSFVLFFPQLIAGPIVRYEEFVPQLKDKVTSSINWEHAAQGFFLFGVGLFKKTIIADTFAAWADAGFRDPSALHFLEAWVASLSYTFQLYFDFSGYTDMAIGVALFFGIHLPINFNSPYKSLSIREFWQRWHISLSRWLRDYLYIPLGGNRKGNIMSLVNIFITFLLGGIWHGAGWNFIIWGAMHGGALGVYRLWKPLNLKMSAIFCWFLTFFFINISWVFFRAESVSEALLLLKAMGSYDTQILISALKELATVLSGFDKAAIYYIDGPLVQFMHSAFYAIIIPLLVFFLPNSMEIIRYIPSNSRLKFKTNIFAAFLLAVLLSLSFMTFIGNVSQSHFLYFEF